MINGQDYLKLWALYEKEGPRIFKIHRGAKFWHIAVWEVKFYRVGFPQISNIEFEPEIQFETLIMAIEYLHSLGFKKVSKKQLTSSFWFNT